MEILYLYNLKRGYEKSIYYNIINNTNKTLFHDREHDN